MDNSVDRSWATRRAAAFALCAGGLILLGAAVLAAPDAVGLLMMGVAGVLLISFGGYALIIRPRLAIDDATPPRLVIRTIGGTRTYAPEEVDRIRLLSLRRVGRRVGQLEFDLLPEAPVAHAGSGPREDTKLVVFSRWDLGADLLGVADELRRAGFDVEDARPLA